MISDGSNLSEFFAYPDMKMHLPTLPQVVLASLLMASAGCATVPPFVSPTGRPVLLGFLMNGHTAKTEVLWKLGQPSGTFAAEEILTYRLGFESKNKGYRVVARATGASPWSSWQGAKYSLVLVFDNQGVLQKHSLVNINKSDP